MIFHEPCSSCLELTITNRGSYEGTKRKKNLIQCFCRRKTSNILLLDLPFYPKTTSVAIYNIILYSRLVVVTTLLVVGCWRLVIVCLVYPDHERNFDQDFSLHGLS